MIVVLGATGKVGRHVVAGLLGRGVPVRAPVRDAAARLPPAVDVVPGDLSRPDELAEHVDGADAAFLVWPFFTADGSREVVDLLAKRVRRIVYLSAEAATHRPDSFWAQVEDVVAATALEWTCLRPTGFAANTVMWADQIRTSDVVRWVYGEAARSLIDERDVAAVAVRALTEAGHTGERYVLTGPQAITQADQVHTIGETLGRGLRWEEIPPDQIADELDAVPDTALKTWASFVETPEVVTTTVADVTGRPARTFAEWTREHAQAFA